MNETQRKERKNVVKREYFVFFFFIIIILISAKTFTGEVGIATGWGATKEGGPVSTTLREVSVPIMSNTECRLTKYPARKITDNMLCAGYNLGQKDSCQVNLLSFSLFFGKICNVHCSDNKKYTVSFKALIIKV